MKDVLDDEAVERLRRRRRTIRDVQLVTAPEAIVITHRQVHSGDRRQAVDVSGDGSQFQRDVGSTPVSRARARTSDRASQADSTRFRDGAPRKGLPKSTQSWINT